MEKEICKGTWMLHVCTHVYVCLCVFMHPCRCTFHVYEGKHWRYLFIYFEVRSLTEPDAHLLARFLGQWSPESSCLYPPLLGYRSGDNHTQILGVCWKFQPRSSCFCSSSFPAEAFPDLQRHCIQITPTLSWFHYYRGWWASSYGCAHSRLAPMNHSMLG